MYSKKLERSVMEDKVKVVNQDNEKEELKKEGKESKK